MASQITDGLLLVANPGSASRKYALYDADLKVRAHLHFEITDDKLACTLHSSDESRKLQLTFDSLDQAAAHIEDIFFAEGVIKTGEHIANIGLRVVAPSGYFMHDHIINDEVVAKLESVHDLAPLHIGATLEELKLLRDAFSDATIVGVSDSAFHAKKPNYAWNYGINIHDADRLDIKRFGYHGLSVESAIGQLWDSGKLAPKVIVCHLGSGSSITGVFHGRTIDTTMGFTPLEGVIMATRSGSIDAGAVRALKRALDMNDDQVEEYLHSSGGLLGLGGSNDLRELIEREADGDHFAHLALSTFIHSIHKAIGEMLVALNGADVLVFTGTIGERSAYLRKRIVAHLEFTDFILDGSANEECTAPHKLQRISQSAKSRPIMVIPTDESFAIANHTVSAVRALQ